MHFTLTSVAVHWCWVSAHLHEQQTFIGVFAVAQALHNALHCSPPKLHVVHCFMSQPRVELHSINFAPLLLAVTHLYQLQQC